MWHTVFKASGVMTLAAALGGCGLFQSVADSTASTAKAVFYKQVKVLRLDFSGRSAVNTDFQDMNALSVPTMVRIYQLKDRKTLDKANYEDLLQDSEALLGTALLEQRTAVVTPEQGVQLNMLMNPDARYVAVVALFRHPEAQAKTWRLLLERDDLDPDDPRVIELGDNHLTLRPLEH